MTGLGRKAKTLTESQLRALLALVERETKYPVRNRVVVLLSFTGGLRAREIAMATWSMATDAVGNLTGALALPNNASKGRSGRVIELHPDLRDALAELCAQERPSPADFIVRLKNGARPDLKGKTLAESRSGSIQFLFKNWFSRLGYEGASSHSGRRTFVTTAARKISQVGGSLRDVQALAGHASLQTTQGYVDTDPEAQRKLIRSLYRDLKVERAPKNETMPKVVEPQPTADDAEYRKELARRALVLRRTRR